MKLFFVTHKKLTVRGENRWWANEHDATSFPNRHFRSGRNLKAKYKIVKAHSGRIWLESKVGKGSTFFVELPLQ